MNTKYMVIVAAMAVMLIGATALATSENAFAGGHGHKKSYEKNQATSQATLVAMVNYQRMSDVRTLTHRFRAMKMASLSVQTNHSLK